MITSTFFPKQKTILMRL